MRSLVFLVVVASAAFARVGLVQEGTSITSDRAVIDTESYRLAVEEQALIWSKGAFPRFIVWPSQGFDIQLKKTIASLQAAEEALRLDETNAYAHALLARYYLVPEDTFELAAQSWRLLLDHGGGVSFPSMYYDVDTKRLFMSHIRQDGIYIYRYGEFGVEKMDALPDGNNTLYWEAHAGHIPPDMEPAAVVHWDDVREIKTGNWVWWIKLANKITLRSDRGKGKSTREIKVALLGGIGRFSWHFDWVDLARGDLNIRTHTYGPADYNARLRTVVLGLVDPEGRIKAPKPPRPGPGW